MIITLAAVLNTSIIKANTYSKLTMCLLLCLALLDAFSHLILKQDSEVDTITSFILEVMRLRCREEKCHVKVTVVDG